MARRGVRSALLGRDQINLSMLADEVDPAAPQAYVKPGEVKFSKVEHQVMLWDVLTGSLWVFLGRPAPMSKLPHSSF